jgi:hypothetical protein
MNVMDFDLNQDFPNYLNHVLHAIGHFWVFLKKHVCYGHGNLKHRQFKPANFDSKFHNINFDVRLKNNLSLI